MSNRGNSHLELRPKFVVVVIVPSECVGCVDPLLDTSGSKHRLQYRVEIVSGHLDAVHKTDLELGVTGQQSSNDGGFIAKLQKSWWNCS